MFRVSYVVDYESEEEAEFGTEEEALAIAATWAKDGRADLPYIKSDVFVKVEEITTIAEFPVKRMDM